MPSVPDLRLPELGRPRPWQATPCERLELCREVVLPGSSTRPEVRVKLFCDAASYGEAQRSVVQFGAYGHGIEVGSTRHRSDPR